MNGYGQVVYLSYPPALQASAQLVHRQLALHGFIVLDPEPAASSDLERSVLANLELAKVRRADRLDIIHLPNGAIGPHEEDMLQHATDLGKRVTHHYISPSAPPTGARAQAS